MSRSTTIRSLLVPKICFFQPGKLLFQSKKFSFEGNDTLILLLDDCLELKHIRYVASSGKHGGNIA